MKNEPLISLENANIAIVGLGLMGGSFALAMNKYCKSIKALDKDEITIAYAKKLGFVKMVSSSPQDIFKDVNFVLLSCPVPSILEWFERLPEYIHHPCIVMDIGSSKRDIVDKMESLPLNFDPIGGHPICGKETLSIINADPDLFNNKPFILTPLNRTSDSAKDIALEITRILKSNPIWLDAESHDRFLAFTSHLPYLLSTSLVSITPREAARCIGSGYESTSRLAATPTSMMFGVLESNRDFILNAIDKFQEHLLEIQVLLRNGQKEALQEALNGSQNKSLKIKKQILND